MKEIYNGIYKVLNTSERLSYKKKTKNNCEWCEEKADAIDMHFPAYYTEERIARFKENYRLYNGKGRKYSKRFESVPKGLKEDGFFGSTYEKETHHDIISPMIKMMVGEQENRPLVPIASDSSKYTQSLVKFKKTQLLQQWIQQELVQPIREQETMKYILENGIQDLYSLTPEQQMQMQSDVNQRVQAMTPKEISQYMTKDFKSPREIQAQKLIDYLIRELDLKFLTDKGFEHGLITGEEFYYVGIVQGKPVVEWVNPFNFVSFGSPDKLFVEDHDWAKRVRWVTPLEVWNRHSGKFTKKDLKKLDSMFEHIYGYNATTPLEYNADQIISSIGPEDIPILQNIDPRTKKGSMEFLGFVGQKMDARGQDFGMVRELHTVWKSLRNLKHLKRLMPDGSVRYFWLDESYELNPFAGDLEIKVVPVPEVWQTTVYGQEEEEKVYVDKGPLPWQFRSLDDPFDTKLPYFGTMYNNLGNNAENIAPIDRAKPWQDKYNIQMGKIQELESTDIGKVMLMSIAAKPDDWSWEKFMDVIRYTKVVPIDTMKEGMQDVDLSVFRQIDLGNMVEIVQRIQFLEYIKQQAALALSFNASRMGQESPYTSVSTNNQNIIRSLNQTQNLFSVHNKVVERMLNGLVRVSRIAFKEKPLYARYIMDDMSAAEIEIDNEMLWNSVIGVKVVNEGEEMNNLEVAKQLIQPMLQAGMISFPDAMKLLWSKSKAEIFNIAEQSEKQRQEQMQQAQQAQAEQAQAQMQMQQDLLRLQTEMKLLLQQDDNASDFEKAKITSMTLANQHDINMNQINDGLERDREKLKVEREQFMKEMESAREKFMREMKFDEKELKQERELKERELDIKEMEAKARMQQAKARNKTNKSKNKKK